VDQAPLDLLIGPARVVAATGPEIGRVAVEAMGILGVERVLFRTAVGAVREPPLPNAWLAADAARLLAERGARLVGIDSLSIDPLEFPPVSAHVELLSRGVWILEALDLSHVPPGDYELLCLPLKIAGGDGAPARVLLRR
jgi:arylformamidase